MKRLLKSNPEYPALVASSPIHFSVKDYGFFLTPEEWQAIPFSNSQPTFNPLTQYLEVRMIETPNGVRREWFVSDIPLEE